LLSCSCLCDSLSCYYCFFPSFSSFLCPFLFNFFFFLFLFFVYFFFFIFLFLSISFWHSPSYCVVPMHEARRHARHFRVRVLWCLTAETHSDRLTEPSHSIGHFAPRLQRTAIRWHRECNHHTAQFAETEYLTHYRKECANEHGPRGGLLSQPVFVFPRGVCRDARYFLVCYCTFLLFLSHFLTI
jgi:hypothetical protein